MGMNQQKRRTADSAGVRRGDAEQDQYSFLGSI
jgi:hypothetical protein